MKKGIIISIVLAVLIVAIAAVLAVVKYTVDNTNTNTVVQPPTNNTNAFAAPLLPPNTDQSTPRTEVSETDCQEPLEYDYNYMMTFFSCDTSVDDCKKTDNHEIYIAGSKDGEQWELIDEWTPVQGSVPEVFFYDDHLYIAQPSSNDLRPNIREVNSCFLVTKEIYFNLVDEDGEEHGYVDPSFYVEGDDVYFTHLYQEDTGPAKNVTGCETYPCEKMMAVAMPTDDSWEEWEIVEGAGVTATLEEPGPGTVTAISDPDVTKLDDGTYTLVLSSGSDTYLFTSDSPDSAYSSPTDELWHRVTRNGGVPSLIEIDDTLWLYVNSKGGAGTEYIHRAALDDIYELAEEEDFTIMINGETFGSDTMIASAPSIIPWPTTNWAAD